MKITILTVGSRGDVQPFLALAVGLKEAGHEVNFGANPEFKEFIETRGIKFNLIRNNPMDILKEEYKDTEYKERRKIYYEFMKNWISDGINAARNSDLIVFTPVYHVGYHVAEKLKKPVIKTSYVPYTPTKEFSNPFLKPLPKIFSKASYLISQFFEWQIIKNNINRLRKEVLGLEKITITGMLRKQHKEKMPIIYGFSENVIPRPHDWPEWIQISGYWFLKDLEEYSPYEELKEFLEGGEEPLYFDIGSLGVYSNDIIIKTVTALAKTKYRIIANPGKSDIKNKIQNNNIFFVDSSVPHAWILPRVKAVISHGGPSTVASILRAGKPLAIIPIYGDHKFWARKVYELKVGTQPMPLKKLDEKLIIETAENLMNNNELIANAKRLGEKIRSEKGIEKAVELIEKYYNSVS